MLDLKDKLAVVTGSSRGIGRAIALELAQLGANLAINHIEHEQDAASVKKEVEALGRRAVLCRADVTDRDAIDGMFAELTHDLGPVTVLVNNAGITRDRTIRKLSHADWDEVIGVNLTGVFNCTKVAVPHMIEAGVGRIVSISSIVAASGAFGQTNYGASKAGIIGFTRSCALELARYGITVNAVCPGYTETSMLEGIPDNVLDAIEKKIPIGRFGKPEEIARCVRFLIAEGEYITGQHIHVNGGLYF